MTVESQLPQRLSLYEFAYENELTRRIDAVYNEPHYFMWIDSAWAAMLAKQAILPAAHVPALFSSILDFWASPPEGYVGFGWLMTWLIEKHGTEMAGSLTMGRTIPPLRQMLPVRHDLTKLMCMLQDLQGVLLDTAGKYLETVMPGYTHIRHAQPMTFGHYLLSVYDPIERIMKGIEDGYAAMSLNELGCGALAGTSWPINREMLNDYLAMDGLIENSNDAVAYTDGYVSLVAALTNLMTVFSRFALDLNYWSGEEYGFLAFPFLGGKGSSYSHFMPNKTESGTYLERTRAGAAELLGQLTELAVMGMRAPHGDGHEMLHMADATRRAIRSTHLYLHVYLHALPELAVHEDAMLAAANRGFACSTELANRLVRECGLDYRTAHEIVNRFVFDAKAEGIPAAAARIEQLQAAARQHLGRELTFSEASLRESLDPKHFVATAVSRGGVAPAEAARMLKARRARLADARGRHLARIGSIEQARARLLADMNNLAGRRGNPS